MKRVHILYTTNGDLLYDITVIECNHNDKKTKLHHKKFVKNER